MLGIFKKKKEIKDFSFLQTDIHSHMIFGLDDGAQTIEDSLELIRNMYNLGFRTIITSPHVHSDFYPNTTGGILTQYKKVLAAIEAEKIDIQFKTAAEYMINDWFMELLKEEEELLTIHDKHVLVEMSYLAESPYLNDALFQLQAKGYIPILVHPERYNFYHHDYNEYKEIKDRGCLLQLNTIALSGYYGSNVKKIATQLLDDGMYDYCGSDMHHMRHFKALQSLLDSKIIHKLSEYPFKNNQIRV